MDGFFKKWSDLDLAGGTRRGYNEINQKGGGEAVSGFWEMMGTAAMFILLMVPGWILGKRGAISESGIDAMGMILTNLAMPSLVLCKLLETEPSALSSTDLLASVAMPVITVFGGLGLGTLFFGGRCGGAYRTERFCASFSNCGFLGIPMAAALFPNAPQVAVCVSLFNVVSTFFLLTVGGSVLSGACRRADLKRLLLSPVTVCLTLGLLLLWIDLEPLNSTVATYTSYFSMLTAPLSMLILGYELSGLSRKELLSCRTLWRTSLIKLILTPLLSLGALALLGLLPGMTVGEPLAIAMLLATGVSTAASAPAMAASNGADRPRAAILTLGTTLLCAVTLPLLRLLFEWIF